MKNRKFLLDEDFIKWRIFRTEKQDAQWKQFRQNNPDVEEQLNEAIEQFNALQMNRTFLRKEDKDAMLYVLIKKIKAENPGQFRIRIWLSSVAIIVFAVLLALFFTQNRKKGETITEKGDFLIGQMLPAEKIYILSGEEKIDIENKSNITLTQRAKIEIIDSSKTRKELALAPVTIHKMVVPFGKRSTLTLSDGTKIWLNSGTEVNFPSTFTGNKREIWMNGEIFIEVTKDSRQQFIVHTDRMEVRVYGTSFNISSYQGEEKESIVLVDGKVTVQTPNHIMDMLPNEKVELLNNRMTKEHVNVAEYISWTRAVLEFSEIPISEILKKIGRYYNIKFESQPNTVFDDKTCTGKLFLSENLDSVMSSISSLSSIRYHRENNIIHIKK